MGDDDEDMDGGLRGGCCGEDWDFAGGEAWGRLAMGGACRGESGVDDPKIRGSAAPV